jgi:hypothetical protein
MPRDQGKRLLQYVRERNQPLIGVSDSSKVKGQGRHAWIITTGDSQHLLDPKMQIHGSGVVDGYGPDLSSACGELQGKVALSIMYRHLLLLHRTSDLPVQYICDNKVIVSLVSKPEMMKLCCHREANMDLLLEFQANSHATARTHKWVTGHQDKGVPWKTFLDLDKLELDMEAKLNIVCITTQLLHSSMAARYLIWEFWNMNDGEYILHIQ